MLLPMVLNSMTPALKKAYLDELLATNTESEKYGLLLSAEDAGKIIETRNRALYSHGRVELGMEAAQELIESFCTSSFLDRENYVPVLNELLELFYYMKNETEDRISDIELIRRMKEDFEDSCGGSVELLKYRLEEFAEGFRRKIQKAEDPME